MRNGSRASAARVPLVTAASPPAVHRPQSLPRLSGEAGHRSERLCKRAALSCKRIGSDRARRHHHRCEDGQHTDAVSVLTALMRNGSRAAAARVSLATAASPPAVLRPQSLQWLSGEAGHRLERLCKRAASSCKRIGSDRARRHHHRCEDRQEIDAVSVLTAAMRNGSRAAAARVSLVTAAS